ncbi:MAG: ATP synthase F1 subunit gamma [Alphaproteobacteria bacterium CG_4_10_14_0_8_um_filter_37_21]|nr:MAG: ATP synthase F1 subunit gamma [Alphaproteobacteria bacterium CG_4_10_14_0_8_um_filter_37_21]
MSTLKQLRSRIKSVTNTRKITSAMKMVAAAKFRKSLERVHNIKPYTLSAQLAVGKTLHFSDLSQLPLLATGSNAPTLYILYAGDRGLCGGFNTSIFKKFNERVKLAPASHNQFLCFGIGKRAVSFLQKNAAENVVSDLQPFENFNFDDARILTSYIAKLLNRGSIGRVEIIYTDFKNALTLVPTHHTVVPMAIDADQQYTPADCPLIEPHAERLLPQLLEFALHISLYAAVLESDASEQAARMSAMDDATRNAEEMVDGLKINYNRTRQSMITRELIEIIAGANASG